MEIENFPGLLTCTAKFSRPFSELSSGIIIHAHALSGASCCICAPNVGNWREGVMNGSSAWVINLVLLVSFFFVRRLD